MSLALGLIITIGHDWQTIYQSILLQVCSFFLIVISECFAARASNRKNSPSLMFVMYLQVDTMQTFLYLIEDLNSPSFWAMLIVCEIASLFKITGLKDWIAFKTGTRRTTVLTLLKLTSNICLRRAQLTQHLR